MTVHHEATPPLDRLRDRIILEATALFSEFGVDSTSMRMIAERLGVTKAALYYHFESKDRLHFQIHLELVDDVLARVGATATAPRPPAEKIREVVRVILESVAGHRDAFTILLREGANLSAPPWNELAAKRAEFRDLVQGIVAEGAASGAFEVADVEVATLALLGMCNWSYTWIEADGRMPVAHVADLFASIFLRGVQGGLDRGATELR
jgi:AcrR family transcriptional regulator